MQLKSLLIASLFALSEALAVDQSPSGNEARDLQKRDVKCSSSKGGYGHEAELRRCIDDLRVNPRWAGEYSCAGKRFYIGGDNWNSPADCMGGCTPCLIGGAELGLHGQACDQATGVNARCWVGWHD